MSQPHSHSPIPTTMAYPQLSFSTSFLPQPSAPANIASTAQAPVVSFAPFPAQAPSPAPARAPAEASVQTNAADPSLTLTLTPFPAQAPSSALPPSTSSRPPEHLMHKNRLQEFTQKLNIPLPIYQTVNEGSQHAPRFRATVLVDGVKYTSPNSFSTRKAAEKDVAELALKYISQKKPDEGVCQGFPNAFPLIHEDTVFCKSILNEFSTKMNMELPTYTTVKPEGLLPVFISSLVFNGVSYSGGAGKNKKEAEQLAARAVILSLLGDSKMGKVLDDIIKSKVKLYAALHKVSNVSTAPLVTNTAHCSVVVPGKDIGVEAVVPASNKTVADSLPTTGDTVATDGLCGNGTPKHEFKIQKPEISVELSNLPESATQATKLPIEFVGPTSAVSIEAGPSSSKKRRKNKRKANKRLCTGAQLPMTTLPLNQTPPCSVTQ